MEHALIFDLYRGTSHDGPGQRSTVFFQGCPLSCKWCHNPEGIGSNLVWWEQRLCIGCMECQKACTHGAIQPREDGVHISDENCVRCGACTRACPSGALSFVAKEWSLEKLLDEVLRDKPYYDRTGGGVTASGGECMRQHSFVSSFFKALHEKGVSTALDTCGLAAFDAFEQVLPHTDYILFDVKLLDAAEHKRFTGQDNAIILANLKRIAALIAAGSLCAELWIRTPLIPDATATIENISAIGRFLANELYGTVARWEMCAFNNSCITKYDRLRSPWQYRNKKLITSKFSEELRQAGLGGGLPADRVIVTGILSE